MALNVSPRALAALLAVLGLPVAGRADAPTPSELFLRGNAAYDQRRFAAARDDFAQLIEGGHDDGWLYYNLGNCELRQGRLGRAIAAYRASAARLPRQRDVRHNLAFAQRQGRDAMPPIEPPVVLSWLAFWHYHFTRHELLYMAACINGLFFLALGLRRVAPWRGRVAAAAPVLGLMGLAVGGSLMVRQVAPTHLMVVVGEEVEVHSGVSYDTVVRFVLHEGTEGRVVDQDGEWLRIELADGKQGWVARDEVAEVVL